MTAVAIGARDRGAERFHWAYFPEKEFAFYRIGSPSEVNPALAPEGHRSFAVEFAHRGPCMWYGWLTAGAQTSSCPHSATSAATRMTGSRVLMRAR